MRQHALSQGVRVTQGVRLLGLGGLVLLLSGCGLFYNHTLSYEDFSLYGNQPKTTLRRTGDTIQDVFDAYRLLFPNFEEKVHGARILYEEDSLSQENIFTGDLRQEGFYLPVLDLIHLSPRRPRGDADDLSVILHEMAHHFLISAHSKTSSQYWLNEGLACCLEVSFFDEEGTLCTPLFHQSLFSQARRILRRDGEEKFRSELSALIGASWFHFHRSDGRNHNYAYSWSLYWHLLNQQEGSLEERVHAIIEMSPPEVLASIDGVISDLRTSADDHLAALSKDPDLRGWCLERWAELPAANGRRFRAALLEELDPERDPGPKSWARATLLINGRIRGISRQERNLLHRRVAKTLGSPDTDLNIRIAIAAALADEGSLSWAYIVPLINGLEEASGELRAASARALARLSKQKPTVVNPGFWRNAPPEIRAVEVAEWRNWYELRH